MLGTTFKKAKEKQQAFERDNPNNANDLQTPPPTPSSKKKKRAAENNVTAPTKRAKHSAPVHNASAEPEMDDDGTLLDEPNH